MSAGRRKPVARGGELRRWRVFAGAGAGAALRVVFVDAADRDSAIREGAPALGVSLIGAQAEPVLAAVPAELRSAEDLDDADGGGVRVRGE